LVALLSLLAAQHQAEAQRRLEVPRAVDLLRRLRGDVVAQVEAQQQVAVDEELHAAAEVTDRVDVLAGHRVARVDTPMIP
jgi:hypothetical protein